MPIQHFIVEKTTQPRFPYRVRLEEAGVVVFAVRAQHAWPSAGAGVFCLRDYGPKEGELLTEVERVPVVESQRLGAKLSFTLDRPTRKRADFLVLTKGHKDGSGTYEQIFFRTQLSVAAHRGKGRPALHGKAKLQVVVDAKERRPWRFNEAEVRRRSLPAGDYALVDGERIVALVERKTFAGFLTDLFSAQIIQSKLNELAAYARPALVVEAQYADLFNPKKIGRCNPAHLARIVAEMAALQPKVQLVWAGNRKLANAWVDQFFVAAARAEHLFVPDALAEMEAAAGPHPVAEGGLDQRIRQVVKYELRGPATLRQIAELAGTDRMERVRRVLIELRKEGAVICRGRGRTAQWGCPPATEPDTGGN